MKKQLSAALAALTLVGVGATSFAQQEASARGEVRRLDADKGSITIKHGAINDLNLPAMTLVYDASPALLQGINPGDEVRFKVRRTDNSYEVIELRK